MLERLSDLPLLGIMLVVTLGYSLGRVDLRGVSLGPAAATLFVALACGHLGLTLPASDPGGGAGAGGLAALGFALFIYSVGFDAAPHFWASFRERRGYRFVAVSIVANAIAILAALGLGRALGLGGSATAGLLAGALTSAPTYAAAYEVAPDPAQLSVAFALTFPFGLVGVVLAIQLLPRLLGEDLARGARSDDELFEGSGPALRPRGDASEEVTRAFEVRGEEVIGHSLRDLGLTRRTGCVISRLRAGDALVIPSGDTVLERGDRVMATGRLDELQVFEGVVGPEISSRDLDGSQLLTRRLQVERPDVAGRTLEELGIIRRQHCVITRVERGTMAIEPDAQVVLVRGDVVEAVGEREDLRDLARRLGRFEPPTNETDIAVYAGGIVLGLLLGSFSLDAFGFRLHLGAAGGLLLVGLVLGSQRRIGPLRTHVPREARQLVRDLGILLFVGDTGVRAGGGVAAALESAGWQTFAAGIVVNSVTVLGALAVALVVLRLRPIDAWGSVCGGITSSAALHAVRRASDSSEVAISYAAAYAVASVLATLAGPLVVQLVP